MKKLEIKEVKKTLKFLRQFMNLNRDQQLQIINTIEKKLEVKGGEKNV